jgi:hypothetical protein
MRFRDRFYTRQTAEVLLSWRLLSLIVSVAILRFGFDLAWRWSVLSAVVIYLGSVLVAMPKGSERPNIDPFTVGEPWRQFVQGAQRASARLRETVESTRKGPLEERLLTIAGRLDHGLDEAFRIARRGHEIDAAVARLDPTALRSKLATLEQQRATAPGDQLDAAIASVQSQLEATDRLKEQSAKTATTLRLVQTRLDELVARAAEVSVGTGDTDAYEHDVDDLVIELEGLRLAVEETNRP